MDIIKICACIVGVYMVKQKFVNTYFFMPTALCINFSRFSLMVVLGVLYTCAMYFDWILRPLI